jgi:hypothetical protein
MKILIITLSSCISIGALACSDSDTPAKHTAKSAAHVATPPKGDATNALPVADAGDWQTLMTGDWTLAPGTESYTCVRKTVTEDLYVNAFEAIIPLGTHHTLLTMGDPDQPDGITACNAGTNRPLSVFGSGVGTDPIHFPDGVALKIAKGTQLLLNLHLFNTGSDELDGTSGTRIQTMQESDVKNLAEGILAGTVSLNLPPGQTTVSTGYCTMSSDVTLFAVAPHMHKLGIYARVAAESAARGETMLFDGPYDFNEQSYHLIPLLALDKGDRVRVECTHRNTTSETVTFGESTLSEMCFAGIYRYPADGSSFACIDPPAATN